HSAAGRTMTRSESMSQILRGQEFKNVEIWHGGVELDIFYPRGKGAVELLSQKKYPKKQIERPIMMYVGRVSKEKNLEAFLSLDNLTGTKVIVGGDSYKQVLEKKYPDAIFLGPYPADKLPEIYSDADVFVMPSKTDTFGRVMVEALACGVPVAAFPVTGSKDIVNTSSVGALNENLKIAIEEALLNSDLDSCVKRAQDFSHLTVAQQFLKNLIETKT
ncbi:MAG: glycosyltransferase, partial [Bdellovibrionales bacterium]|nr:glycosyltransferase [Bdellovibrionales bacterium]